MGIVTIAFGEGHTHAHIRTHGTHTYTQNLTDVVDKVTSRIEACIVNIHYTLAIKNRP